MANGKVRPQSDRPGQVNMPIVLSAVGVEMGVYEPTRASILTELPRVQEIDWSSMNAWEMISCRNSEDSRRGSEEGRLKRARVAQTVS
ncbi:MAG: hypothetical protein ACJ8E1_10520 [Xanthobacteraceae bacterium]